MTAEPPPNVIADPLIGRTLAGRYRLARKVGEGGMGAVYEAVQEALGRTVAVKILRDKYLDRPEVAQRLVKEAQLASSIEHEHIVRILDSGVTEDGRPFVVMEHLRGESLAERIRREGALPPPFVIELCIQSGGALAAAHARSIVHRDVKPENIFLVGTGDDDRPSVKIVDFGISKSMIGAPGDSNLRLTATGMVLGTPLYMSPEQARGDEELDERVDVYSLGVILYEALTGEVPFTGGNYLGVISQVLGAEVVPPRVLRPELGLSPELEHVVMRAMSRDRDRRYATMTALIADLESARDGNPLDEQAQPPEPDRPRERRPRALWPVGAVLGVGAFALFTIPYFGKLAAPVVVVTPAAPVDAAHRPDALPATVALLVKSEPDGAEVLIGDRSYGIAPRTIMVPPGKVHLTLRLSAHEDSAADAVAGVDPEVTVRLRPLARPPGRPPARSNVHVAPPNPAAKPAGPSGAETLPNPY
jgi:serine/threonine-protein kinase